jgi:hypothetical protein
LAKAPYYIIIARKNQVLLSFLKIRVVVNNHDIYPLTDSEPVVIPVEKDHPRIVVTDGFHFTKPLELEFKKPSYFNFNVVCAIDDMQLLGASLLLAILYLLGFITNLFVLRLLSFTPVVWFLFYYYFNRKNFIRIVRAKD